MRIMHIIRGIIEICQKHDLKPTKLHKYFVPISKPRATLQRNGSLGHCCPSSTAALQLQHLAQCLTPSIHQLTDCAN